MARKRGSRRRRGIRGASQAAQRLKPAVLELGGKNALLVLQDADVDYAVDAAVFGSFRNAGQICMCVDRVVVHRAVADEFTAKFADRVRALPCGDPGDAGTAVGPVVSAAAARRAAALVEDAVAKGAEPVVGTGEIEGRGTLMRPVVLTGVTREMKVYYDEIFGPATVVHVVDSTDETVALANDTPYGLTAGVITENLAAGLAVAGRLRTGIVHVNDQSIADEPQAPSAGRRAPRRSPTPAGSPRRPSATPTTTRSEARAAHTGGSVPACSLTMYRAYHSGQSGSSAPVRASCSPWAAAARRRAPARSPAEANSVVAGSSRPGSLVVTSWRSRPLPSGKPDHQAPCPGSSSETRDSWSVSAPRANSRA
ncbi:aldehyde dehydrogenase family protein [Streptomyces chartreusis]|uniref:aldehyde dehydrogenase family protein n=1 Tax=Streptomyces chartreusis TaxID=1969 RepID=UPI0036407CC5